MNETIELKQSIKFYFYDDCIGQKPENYGSRVKSCPSGIYLNRFFAFVVRDWNQVYISRYPLKPVSIYMSLYIALLQQVTYAYKLFRGQTFVLESDII